MTSPSPSQILPVPIAEIKMRRPKLGLYLDRAPVDIDPRGLEACQNARIENDRLRIGENMGWEKFPAGAVSTINLDGEQVLMFYEHFHRDGSRNLVMGTRKDLFRFRDATGDVRYITPVYVTGTIEVAGGALDTVVGTGTAWDTLRTVNYRSGTQSGLGKNAVAGMEISFGSNAETDPAATWYVIQSVNSDTSLTLASNATVQAPGTDYTLRQTFSGDEFDVWDQETFPNWQHSAPFIAGSDVLFLTNGVEEIVIWDGNASHAQWFYDGFLCKGLTRINQILLAYYTIEGGTIDNLNVNTSDLNFPMDFTTGAAASIVAAGGVSDILKIIQMGDVAVAYYRNDVSILEFVGPPTQWIARTVVPGIGMVAKGLLMDFGIYHEFLSKDRGYQFDGVSVREFGHQVFRDVLRRQSPTRVARGYAHIREDTGEVLWVVPLTTDGTSSNSAPAVAFVTHYLLDVGPSLPVPITQRELTATAMGYYLRSDSLHFDDIPGDPAFSDVSFTWDDRVFEAAFPFSLIGLANGDVFIYGTSSTKDGVAMTGFVRFPRRALVDGDRVGLLRTVEIEAGIRSSSIDIVPLMYDRAEATIEGLPAVLQFHSSKVQFSLDQTGHRRASIRRSGRFCVLGLQASMPFDVSGYRLRVSPMGER